MSKMKKILALLLALCCLVSVIAGCNNQETPDTKPNDNQGETKAPEKENDETEAPDLSDVTIVWYFMGNDSDRNDEVFAKANEMVQEALGFSLECHNVPAGDYEQKIKMIMNSGEPYDICWASNWRNNYLQNIGNEAFLPLDEYLANTPALVEAIPEALWEASKVQGSIYGVTCQQVVARATTAWIPESFAATYDSLVGTDVDELADLTPYMAEVTAANPGTAIFNKWWQDMAYLLNFEPILGTLVPGAVDLEGGSLKVYNQFATEGFLETCKTVREWSKNGYMMPTLNTSERAEYYDYEQALAISTYTPGSTTMKRGGVVCVQRKLSDAYVTTGGVTSTMMCVNINSEHPAEAVKFLEFLNTNADFMNLMTFGIEGVDYNLDENGRAVRVENMYGNDGWRIGNTFLNYLTPSQEADAIENTAKLNAEAKASQIAGWSPDTTNIQLEMTNCQTVVTEYMDILYYGAAEDVEGTINEMLAKLETAGVQKIIDELQAQIDAWLKVK